MTILTHADRAEVFAQRVIAGDILACKWVKAACQRHLDDLERVASRDPDWPYYLDSEEANRVCAIIERMPHVKGDGAKPERTADGLVYPKLVLEDFESFIVASLFGWLDSVYRLRRFRRAYLEEARKNAKSTLAAAIGLYMLCADGEEGPEIYASATKKDQAKIIWEEVACEMVARQPEFKQLGVGYNKSRIYCTHNGGKFTPLARDYGSLDGLNTSCFVSDELHAQKDRKLYDVLDSSTGARSQPLGLGITTAGTDRAGVCYAQRTYITKILNAVLHRHDGMGYTIKGGTAEDETYFGIIFTLDSGYAVESFDTPEAAKSFRDRGFVVDEEKQTARRKDDDWADESAWRKANPMLDAVHSPDYARTLLEDLRAACQKARSMASEQAEFRTKRCNQWLNADVAWMDMHAWSQCGDADLSEDEFVGAECCLGLDAAFKTDVFAKMKLFEREGHYYAFGAYFMPDRMVRLKGNDHLAAWADEGKIQVTAGPVLDIEQVRTSICGDDEKGIDGDQQRHVIREIAFDPAQLTQFAGEMIDDGFTMVEIRPNVLNFSEAMKKLEELVLENRFHHNGDPVLEWMISNVVCHRDHKDNIYPNKEKPENKIDGVIGLIMCLSRMLVPVNALNPDFAWL